MCNIAFCLYLEDNNNILKTLYKLKKVINKILINLFKFSYSGFFFLALKSSNPVTA